MSSAHENALIAIADPIVWQRHQSGSVGFWDGSYGSSLCEVHAPDKDPKDVDAGLFDLSWYITVGLEFHERDYQVLVTSAAQGKAIRARHAITQDLTELNALQQETQAATKPAQWFMEQETEAMKQYVGAFFGNLVRARTWLKWLPEEKFARAYQTTGTRGSYALCFDPARRWSVTVTHNGETVPGPCFVTNHIACMACSYDDYSGEWYLTLPTTPGALPSTTSEE